MEKGTWTQMGHNYPPAIAWGGQMLAGGLVAESPWVLVGLVLQASCIVRRTRGLRGALWAKRPSHLLRGF